MLQREKIKQVVVQSVILTPAYHGVYAYRLIKCRYLF